MIGVLGVIDDVRRRVRSGFADDGAQIFLLGETRDEFGGSAWADVVHGFLGGRPPAVDLAREKVLADVLIAAAADGLLGSAHDLSDGGLAQALAESCLLGGVGAHIELPDRARPVRRAVQRVGPPRAGVRPAHRRERVHRVVRRARAACTHLGMVDVLEINLEVRGQFSLSLRELRSAWWAALRQRFE